MKKLKRLSQKFSERSSRLTEIPLLLTRLTIGLVFIHSGWGKLHHLSRVTEFFHSLGIPAASVQAPMVACIELGCGLLVLLGLGIRLAALPLIGTMVVALVTAKRSDIGGVNDLLGMSEFLYIVLLCWLVTYGAGQYSLVCQIRKNWR